jgi:two-component system sensor histidine kinase YesM
VPRKTPYRSIKFQLAAAILIVMLPLISLMSYNYYYSVRVLYDQVAKSNKNAITLYMNQIDLQLQEADKYLLRKFLIDDASLSLLEGTLSPEDRVLARIRLFGELREDILVYPLVDSFFVYLTEPDDLIQVFAGSLGYGEKSSLGSYVRAVLPLSGNGTAEARWSLTQVEEMYYLLLTRKISSGYVGAWINAEKVLSPLQLVNMDGKGTYLLAGLDGLLTDDHVVQAKGLDLSRGFAEYYLSGREDAYLVVGADSTVGDFSLVALIPDESVLADMPYIKRVLLWIVFMALLTLPAGLIWLNRFILNPLNRIVEFMKGIGAEGLPQTRLANDVATSEFQLIVSTFNRMLDRIEKLKIDVYEEKLSKQKAELKHLQLQVKPHFFLNALNIIHSLAQLGDCAKIQEMIQYLTNYFRYVFRTNTDLVTLGEELEYVRNYIGIEQLRFPERLDCRIEVESGLLDVPIPPLTIQSFVENSTKYAVSLDRPLLVEIGVRRQDDRPHVAEITIKDNGEGFAAEILDKLRRGEDLSRRGWGIGISNVRRRLELLYGPRAQISFFNQDGAVVVISLDTKGMESGPDAARL